MRKALCVLFMIAVAELFAGNAFADVTYNYSILDVPGASDTAAYAIDGNNIVGYYDDDTGTHGFLYDGTTYRTLDDLTSQAPDFPDYAGTWACGIDGSNIVGYYQGYNPQNMTWTTNGFLYNGTTASYQTLDVPGSNTGTTWAWGISGNNIVGYYWVTKPSGIDYNIFGFLYNGTTYQTLSVPGASSTQAYGVSGNNIVGYYADDANNNHGFLYNGTTYQTLDFPGATATYALGISGDNIVGYYQTEEGGIKGFLYNGTTYQTIAVPGYNMNYACGISGGNIVGHCQSKVPATVGFLATPSGGNGKNLGGPCPPNGCVGNPINTATGNKTLMETDFTGAANTGLKVVRAYNSQATSSSPFGANWLSTWHRTLAYTAAAGTTAATAQVTREDGRVDTFTLSGSTWASDPDVTSQLSAVTNTKKEQTGWLLTRDDDSKELYTLTGLLASITTRAGLVTTLGYDSKSRLAKVTGPFGHTLSFAYNAGNLIATITLPDGKTLGYSYDANNNLTSVTYPDSTVRQYPYENTGFPHALTGIVDEDGNRFATYAYDTQGRAISTQHAGGAQLTTVTYNADGSAGVTDADNNTCSYGFTTQFNFTKPTALDQTSSGGGAASYTYDTNGFLASMTDFDGNVTARVNNARGLEVSRTEAQGTALARTITTQWHPTFHLPTQITEPNRVTTFAYDAHGNLLNKTITAGAKKRTWTYTYNAKGQPLTINGPRTDVQDVTKFTYDTKGDLATVTDALGHKTSITSHDADGRPLTVKDPNGLVTNLTYDPRGRLTSRAVGTETTAFAYDAAGNLTKITLPDASYLVFTYDAAHRLTGITDALGDQIAYTLDAMDNRVKESVFDPSNALSQTRSHVYDQLNRLARDIGAQGQTTTYSYDNNSNITGVTDPLGNQTSKAYDALNRLVQVTDPNSGVTAFGYDANDHLTGMTDPRNLVTAYSYDGLNDLTSNECPDTGTTNKTYDAAGNVITSTDARGKITTYAYDALNRPTKATYADKTFTTWQYDKGTNGIGRLTAMTDPSGTTTWAYDQHGRVTRKQQKTGKITLTTAYTYDTAGRVATIVYPSGKKLTNVYDVKSGQLAGIQVDGQALVSDATYLPFGPVAAWTMGNGGTYARSFDQDGRQTSR